MINKNYLIYPSVAVFAAASWFYFVPKVSHTGEYKPSVVSPQIVEVPKEVIHPAQVKVYPKSVKKTLNLPQATQENDSIYVLDSSKLPADDHPQTVTTTLDEKTGEVKTEVRQDEFPWLAAEQTGYVRLSYGVKTGRGKIGRLSVSENLIQIKALHAGVDASIDSDTQMYAGVHVDYAW